MSSNQVEMEEALNTEGITSTQVLGRVNALIKLQEAQEVLTEEMEKEILAIEKKYLAKFQPLAEKRNEIVTGKVEPSDEEKSAKEPISVEGLTSKPEEKGIPSFWLNVLKNTEIGGLIEEVDVEPLTYLADIKVVPIGDESDYSLDFHFTENPFFTNTVISKIVHIKEQDLENIESTPINWKEGKNFTVQTIKKQVKSKGKGKAPTTTTKSVQEPVNCFFGTVLATFESEDSSEEEQEQVMLLQFQLISKLKDIVVPNAVDFFLGRADDTDGQDDFGDYDFEGEDFDDEEDEEEDEPVVRTKGARGGKPAPPQDPNCKQQ